MDCDASGRLGGGGGSGLLSERFSFFTFFGFFDFFSDSVEVISYKGVSFLGSDSVDKHRSIRGGVVGRVAGGFSPFSCGVPGTGLQIEVSN